MALFTDGSITTIDDLAAHDTGLMGVAGAEGIDLTRKLALAQDELEVELMALLPRVGAAAGLDPALPGLAIRNVVVTRPLRFWHVFHTLELVYRDAYNNQLNDRYRGKWEQYRELSKWAAEKLMETGVGITPDPVARAEAPRLTTLEGGTAAEETTYYVRAAWTSGLEEGAASIWSVLSVPPGMLLHVEVPNAPANATAWNVFVGFSADELRLQNPEPLLLGTAWVQNGAVADSGRRPGDGQPPSYLRAMQNVLQRW